MVVAAFTGVVPAQIEVPVISVAFLSDWNQIHALRDRWEYLFSRTEEASFTQTFDWYCAAFESSSDGPAVAVAVVAGKMIGLWPMFRSTARTLFGPARTLRSGGPEAPYLGPIGPHPTATAALVARQMRTSNDWDSALLTAASRSDFDVARYTAAFHTAGLIACEKPAQPIGVICLERRWIDLLSQCSEQVRLRVVPSPICCRACCRLRRLRVRSCSPCRRLGAGSGTAWRGAGSLLDHEHRA